MGFIIYLIRPSEHSIARSLCVRDGSEVVVTLNDSVPPGKVEQTVKTASVQKDDTLSYNQVLALILEAEKVIAL